MHEATFLHQLLTAPECLPLTQAVTIDDPHRLLSVTYLREAYVLGQGYVRQTQYPDGRNLHAGEGGVLTADYGVIEGSYLRQDHIASLPARYFAYHPQTGKVVLKQPPQPTKRVSGTYYCLGNLLRHFGHFLLDGLPYLWYLLRLPEAYRASLKYIHLGNPIPSWGWAFLHPFGITPDKVVCFTRCTQVEALIVPSASYQPHTAQHPAFQAVLDTLRMHYAPAAVPHQKVFLSRQQQPSRILINQTAVEQYFKQHGYQIIQPENYSIAEQIRLAASASHLAGPIGSNLYLAGFQCPGTTLYVLKPQHYTLPDDQLLAEQGHRHCIEITGSPLSEHPFPQGEWTLSTLPTL